MALRFNLTNKLLTKRSFNIVLSKNLGNKRSLINSKSICYGGAFLTTGIVISQLVTNLSYCDDSGDDNSDKGSLQPGGGNNNDPISSAITSLSPMINKLGMGGLLGICSGYAFKRFGKEVAFVVGCGFIVLQVLINYSIHIISSYF